MSFSLSVGRISLVSLILAAPFAAALAAPNEDATKSKYESLELFQKVLHFVETNYVDEVKSKKLLEGAIKGMMDTLDPHSNFLTADIFKDMKADTSGRFGGIGIEIGMKENQLVVVSPMEDTPAWKAGMKTGDKILRINGESTKGMNLVEAVSKMRGKKGTEIRLTIGRDGSGEKPRELKLVRDTIKVQSVKYELLPDGFGYVRLATFNEDAARDVKRAIEKLEKQEKGGKLKGLVFDLRMNPGGLLDQAVDVSSLFIDEGVIVSTIGRDRNQKEVRHARKGMARKDIPLAVLVNAGSASASEIVAGALQDNKRAIILGQTTFGKGSVQQVVELGNDLGLKLTIARYYTPSGRSIQEKGVQPDIVLDDYDPKVLAQATRKSETFRERDLKGHMINPDEADKKNDGETAKSDDTEPQRFNPKEDYQVKQAVNYLKSFEFYQKIGKAPGANET